MKGSLESTEKQSRKANDKAKAASKTSINAKKPKHITGRRTSINNVVTDDPTTTYLCGTKAHPCVAHKTIGDRPFTGEDFTNSSRDKSLPASRCRYCAMAKYAITKAKREAKEAAGGVPEQEGSKQHPSKRRPAIDKEEYTSSWDVSAATKFLRGGTLTGRYKHGSSSS